MGSVRYVLGWIAYFWLLKGTNIRHRLSLLLHQTSSQLPSLLEAPAVAKDQPGLAIRTCC